MTIFHKLFKFGYKYGISGHFFVFNLMLARNNTDWVWVSCKSLACFWFCCQHYQTVHFTSKTWQQPPIFSRFVKDGCWVFGKKIVILDSGGNYLCVKDSAAIYRKIGAPSNKAYWMAHEQKKSRQMAIFAAKNCDFAENIINCLFFRNRSSRFKTRKCSLWVRRSTMSRETLWFRPRIWNQAELAADVANLDSSSAHSRKIYFLHQSLSIFLT